MLVAFTSMVFVGAVLLSEGVFDIWLAPSRTAAPVYAVQFAPCSGPSRVTCVVDGDTIWLEGRKIRLADIDTPEVTSPHCAYELSLGHRATERLTQLLNAGPFSVERAGRDKDIYSRDLRIVTRNGNSLGDVLVREGLAHVWDGGKHSWCG
ncbi:MAG: thermonuclease family protein [Alphaproteobacteria bacterium]|nr:thermonuclease family protein [Alphaproteobacteria bacterium]